MGVRILHVDENAQFRADFRQTYARGLQAQFLGFPDARKAVEYVAGRMYSVHLVLTANRIGDGDATALVRSIDELYGEDQRPFSIWYFGGDKYPEHMQSLFNKYFLKAETNPKDLKATLRSYCRNL